MIKIAYRTSEAGFDKVKPDYINTENCLANTAHVFPVDKYEWYILADSVSTETMEMIQKYVPEKNIERVSIQNGPGYPFMHSLDKMLSTSNAGDIIYFIENDYLHRVGADIILHEGFDMGAHYVTLYDHPDKYINAGDGGNPYIEDNGEIARVFLTKSCHWKLTNSTTGTFASTIETLKNDYQTIKKFANQPYWDDFHMFLEMGQRARTLISCIPGYATHGETKWLCPLVDWKEVVNKTI